MNFANERNETPLMWACQSNNIEMVKVLMENNANPNIVDVDNFSPFMAAVQLGNRPIVEILLNL